MDKVKTTQLAKIEDRQLAQYSTGTQNLIRSNEKWTELVQSGKFEENKALLSMQITETHIKAVRPKTIQQVFETETPTLATIKKYQSDVDMNAVLHSLIYWVRDSLSVGKSLSDQQVEIASELIFDDYYYLTIADFKLCFKNGVKGKYGKIYDRIDPQVLYEWVTAYVDERFEYSETIGRVEPEKIESEYYDGKIVKKIIDSLESKAKKEAIKKQQQKPISKYQAIESWCIDNNVNIEEKTKQLELMWRMEYNSKPANDSVSFDLFKAFKVGQFLAGVNSVIEQENDNKIQ